MSLQCAIQGSAGFRCVARIFNIVKETVLLPSFPAPSFSTMRYWTCKLGLYNLLQPPEAGKWILIIDSSVKMGSSKCLLILGVQVKTLLSKDNFILSYNDVRTIALKTLESCKGEEVKKALDEIKSKGVEIIAVISDEASEFKRGIRLFQEEHKENQSLVHLHDITHKVDLVLKKELANDDDWEKFTAQIQNTVQKLKLTPSSHLIPPKQRQKSRMRSEVDSIEWGIKVCNYLKRDRVTDLEKEKLSWVLNFQSPLNTYQEMAKLFDMTTKEVRENGYRKVTVQILKDKGEHICSCERSRSFLLKILKKVEEETEKIAPGDCLLGCSEIIESVLGKYKQLERDHSSGGITSLVLSVPALVGNITKEIVKNAMEAISIDKINEWTKENLGSTFWALRRGCLRKEEEDGNESYLDLDDISEVTVS